MGNLQGGNVVGVDQHEFEVVSDGIFEFFKVVLFPFSSIRKFCIRETFAVFKHKLFYVRVAWWLDRFLF